jgi:hypothetical protein
MEANPDVPDPNHALDPNLVIIANHMVVMTAQLHHSSLASLDLADPLHRNVVFV